MRELREEILRAKFKRASGGIHNRYCSEVQRGVCEKTANAENQGLTRLATRKRNRHTHRPRTHGALHRSKRCSFVRLFVSKHALIAYIICSLLEHKFLPSTFAPIFPPPLHTSVRLWR